MIKMGSRYNRDYKAHISGPLMKALIMAICKRIYKRIFKRIFKGVLYTRIMFKCVTMKKIYYFTQ